MKQLFIDRCMPWARVAGERFGINPVVIVAQAALETGWGQSTLCCLYHNYFGMGAWGKANDFWDGSFVQLATGSMKFRRYESPEQSFLDYGRLISTNYKSAAAMSYHPEAFAKEIAYSRYISEVNGDNREAYRKALCAIAKVITNSEELRIKKTYLFGLLRVCNFRSCKAAIL